MWMCTVDPLKYDSSFCRMNEHQCCCFMCGKMTKARYLTPYIHEMKLKSSSRIPVHGTKITPELVQEMGLVMTDKLADYAEKSTLQKLCLKKVSSVYTGKWNLQMDHHDLNLPIPTVIKKKLARELIHKQSKAYCIVGNKHDSCTYSWMQNFTVSFFWAHLGYYLVLSGKRKWAHPRVKYLYATSDWDYDSD